MPSIKSISRAALLSITALFLTLSTPFAVLAAADTCKPDTTQPGVNYPTGSDASQFTYQCAGTYAGEWTSAYDVYNPANGSRTPLYSPDYAYDCTTGKWTMTRWNFSAADNQYHKNRPVTTAPAGMATNCPVIPSSSSSTGGGSGSTGAGEGGTSTAGATGSSAGGINTTGPNSNNNVNTTGNTNQAFNNNTNASMNNTITGVATTGNSLVLSNTTAGGAATGDAQDIANVVNMLQSSSNALGAGSNVVTFTHNIDGDVNGDLLLDPSQLSNVQNASTVNNTGPGSNSSLNNNLNNNLTVNNSTNAGINNNINLAANSGNAQVSNNTSGGDATTGSTKAIANIVNTINSALTAGKSFIGTININGNLNGDILLPDNFVDQLLAANTPTVTITGPSSNNTANNTANSNTTVNNTNNLGINNNVNANAASGKAGVSNNTTAGNAATGDATTHITAFNLTGSKVVGANDILVFVNVLGKWVGVIVNAPAGTTAASLGGGISSTGPNSANSSNSTANNNATVNNTVNAKINNNITTNANSGNALVASNTKGGNARSGDASSAVNLLNVENSSLNLSGWLGILFINVFGTWNGSFGVNTAAGNPIATSSNSSTGGSGINNAAQVFRFVANNNTANGANGSGAGSGSGSNGNSSSVVPSFANIADPAASAVLAAQNVKTNGAPSPKLQSGTSSLGRTLGIIGGFTILTMGADALYSRRKAHQSIRNLERGHGRTSS